MSSYSFDYFAEEAGRFREAIGTRKVMLSPVAREAALKAFCHVGLRCNDSRVSVIIESHVLDFSMRVGLVQRMEQAR